MIRDKNKIYGEANDPNTVLAAGTLGVDRYIVGAGNKGVKQFAPGAKRILITGADGLAGSFAFGTPNKAIGTDGNGNLVLLDQVTERSQFKFGGSDNPITSVTLTGGGASSVTYTLLNDADGASAIICTRTADTYAGIAVECAFRNQLSLSYDRTAWVCATVTGTFQSFKDLALVKTDGTKVQLQNGAIGDGAITGAGCAVNKTITLPAGTYKGLYVNSNMLSGKFDNKAIIVNCQIIYW